MVNDITIGNYFAIYFKIFNFMKKISFLVLIPIFVLIQSCENNDINFSEDNFSSEAYLNKFYNSRSYNNLNLNSRFEATNINAKESQITFIKNEQNIDVPIINIFIKNNAGILIGKIEAVSFVDKKGNTDFNILLRNYEKFNINKKKGSITLTDITENFVFAKASIRNGEITKRISFNNPNKFLSKTHRTTSPMDLDGDGNITWSECYKYANDACQTDTGCYSMCYFFSDAVGWVVSGAGPLCQGAIASVCVVTAWRY